MEKKAFIKVETFDGGVHISNGGTNYQTLLTFKQIVEFIWKRPKDATRALIQIISVDGELDSLFKSEKETN